MHVLKLVLGFVSGPLVANRLGITASADVYTIATDIVTSIWRFYEKVVNPTFLPCFIGALKGEGEDRAWRFNTYAERAREVQPPAPVPPTPPDDAPT